MKYSLISLFLFSSLLCTGQSGFVGSWKGELTGVAAGLELIFHISRTDSGFTCSLEVPAQGLQDLPADSVFIAVNSIYISFERIRSTFDGMLTAEGGLLVGQWHQSGMDIGIRMEKFEDTGRTPKPQEPVPPFPYESREVSFPSASDSTVLLSGTLTYPPGAKEAAPAVVLVTGSGPQDRDESLMGHKPFLVLSDMLTRAGIVVLRYDDRGVGDSGGDFAQATTEEFSEDALGALKFLRTQDFTKVSETGVIGHSEGGMVAMMLAARQMTDFVVLMAAPGLPTDDLLIQQIIALNRMSGRDNQTIKADTIYARKLYNFLKTVPAGESLDTTVVSRLAREYYDSSQAVRQQFGTFNRFRETQLSTIDSRWFIEFVKFDPSAYLKKITCPVLAVNGGKDIQVHGESNLAGLRKVLIERPGLDVETRLFPELNHLFQPAETGGIEEYGQIETTIDPRVADVISAWIMEKVD